MMNPSPPADYADYLAWKAQQDAAATTPIVEPTINEVLHSLVHSAKLPNETIARKYLEIIDAWLDALRDHIAQVQTAIQYQGSMTETTPDVEIPAE
jgi:hypothetical protein